MTECITNTKQSYWISASAGCGKTTLLIKRLLALLVSKAQNIICITFTNAAVNEMQNRLLDQLYKLSVMDQEQIRHYLKQEINWKSEIDCLYLKELFYNVDSYVNISTFHSFCFEILKKIDLTQGDCNIQNQKDKAIFDYVTKQFLCSAKKLNFNDPESITENNLQEAFNSLLEGAFTDSLSNKKDTKNPKDQINQSTKSLLKNFDLLVQRYKECGGRPHTYTSIIDNFISKKPWDLFEIANNIDHVLVDEAQDTNLKQWYIIAKLCQDFFIQDGKSLFVVGDQKQSIYGFQGADPAFFSSFYHILKLQDQSHKLLLDQIKKSYRSAKPILDFVNVVCKNADLGIPFKEDDLHVAHRKNCPGYIELTPLVGNCDDANLSLAKSIVSRITEWILQKRILHAKKRPVLPCDIAVLVAHRTSFVALLYSGLQDKGIKVNFVGKIKIEDSKILQLLTNLVKFLACKYDDFALIDILTSPIFQLSKQQIFDFASTESDLCLLDRIKKTKAFDKLNMWLSYSGTPFNLITSTIDSDTHKKLSDFYGAEFDYYLDIFLDSASKHQSIYDFLDILIKKDASVEVESSNKDGVTISTVHGAKGMQYPIVVIADSNYVPQHKDVFLRNKENITFWRKEQDQQVIEQLKQAKQQEIQKEHMRLLYVAITRAEDELYIMGTGKKPKKNSWQSVCIDSMQKIGAKSHNDALYHTNKDGYLNKDNHFAAEHEQQKCQLKIHNDKEYKHIKPEKKEHKVEKASILANQKALPAPNLDAKKGELIHKALEYISKIKKDDQKIWLKNFLKNFGLEFDTQEKEEIFNLVKIQSKVSNSTGNELCEVEVIDNGHILRIDRLEISQDLVLITDYKTSKEKILTEEIELQLQKYKDAIKKIYPHKKVHAKVVWI